MDTNNSSIVEALYPEIYPPSEWKVLKEGYYTKAKEPILVRYVIIGSWTYRGDIENGIIPCWITAEHHNGILEGRYTCEATPAVSQILHIFDSNMNTLPVIEHEKTKIY